MTNTSGFRSMWATARVAIKCRRYKASLFYGPSQFALRSEILLKIIMYVIRISPFQGPRSYVYVYVSYNPVLIAVLIQRRLPTAGTCLFDITLDCRTQRQSGFVASRRLHASKAIKNVKPRSDGRTTTTRRRGSSS